MGPGPPLKRASNKGKSDSMRRLNTGGPGSSAGASTADTPRVLSSMDGTTEEVSLEGGTEDWNRRRYQRADEALWGSADLESEPGESIRMTMMGISVRNPSGTFYAARNPAVNDLHPPVVSTPPSCKNETRWMLQPPPSAKVMSGKTPANRSRSTTSSRQSSYPQKEAHADLLRVQSSNLSTTEDPAFQGREKLRHEPGARDGCHVNGAADSGLRPFHQSQNAVVPVPSQHNAHVPRQRKHKPVLSPVISFQQHPNKTDSQASRDLENWPPSLSLPLHSLTPSSFDPSESSASLSRRAELLAPSPNAGRIQRSTIGLVDQLDLAVSSANLQSSTLGHFRGSS